MKLHMHLVNGPAWETSCNGVIHKVPHATGWYRAAYVGVVIHYSVDDMNSSISVWLDGVHGAPMASPPDDAELLLTVGGYVEGAQCVFDAPPNI